MLAQWCSHPTNHTNSTKFGSKPNHPRGDRKIDDELATRINRTHVLTGTANGRLVQKGDFLCRTCYEQGTGNMRQHKIVKNTGNISYEHMDIDNRPLRQRRSVISDLGEMLNSNFSLEETIESSCSESSGESEPDCHEQIYQHQKAKELLSQVFVVLGIPPITDLRNTNTLQREVAKAIDLIRKSADEVLSAPETSVLSVKKSPLSVDDVEALLDGLKLLFTSSDYDEQVRLLTLAPLNWGRVQIENYFSCNQWQARKALELRKSFGVLATVANFVGNHPIDPQLVEDIKTFFQEDGISRQTSNKKEVIHVDKQPIPIRYMSMSVGQAYSLFMQKVEEKKFSESVSKSVFYSLRPKWVKILTPHDVCVCLYHGNYDLLIKAWNRLDLVLIDRRKLIDKLVCQSPTEQCYFAECYRCKDNLPSEFLKCFLNDQVSQFDEVFWMSWQKPLLSSKNEATQSTTNKISLQRIEGSVDDLLAEMDSQWYKFLKHDFTTTQQFDYIKKIKEKANEHDVVVIQMDFSENHNLLKQHEVMQAHWTTNQAAIFTAHVQVNTHEHHSLAVISNSLAHDVKFVHASQGIIVDYVQSIYPFVRRLNYVSDGVGQHFKNNKNIFNLTYHQKDFGLPASWTFSATSHGKGPMDGIGAAIKYRATRKVLSGKAEDAILTPEQLFEFAQKDTKINVFYLDERRIDQNSNYYKLENRWRDSKVEGWVNQIRSQHQFDPTGIKKVTCRRTSTSLLKETNELID